MGNNEVKEIRVAAAAIIRDGRVLVAQRPECDVYYKSLKWEFPGGKIESGETPEEAVEREISEELCYSIKVDRKLCEIVYDYPDFTLRMTVLVCYPADDSEPYCKEHNALRWCRVDELPQLDWADADAACYPMLVIFMISG